MITNFSGDEQR